MRCPTSTPEECQWGLLAGFEEPVPPLSEIALLTPIDINPSILQSHCNDVPVQGSINTRTGTPSSSPQRREPTITVDPRLRGDDGCMDNNAWLHSLLQQV